MNTMYNLNLNKEELEFLANLLGQLPTKLGAHNIFSKVNLILQTEIQEQYEGPSNSEEPPSESDTDVRPS
jgi:hypothetical protein